MIQTAMILAAGRGERMRPLTDTTPKPLLEVGNKPLIQHHIEKLANAGIRRIVINHAWLGEHIEAKLGDGSRFNVDIVYSREEQALETAGGIANALPLLGAEPFFVVNGDVYCELNFKRFCSEPIQRLARLLMVPNPVHNSDGDFAISNGLLTEKSSGIAAYTFSGIAIYRPEFFSQLPVEKRPLAPEIRKHMSEKQVEAQLYHGRWCDVGTPDRLTALNEELGG